MSAILRTHDSLAGRRIGNRLLLAAHLQHRIPPRSRITLDAGRDRLLHAVLSRADFLNLSVVSNSFRFRSTPLPASWPLDSPASGNGAISGLVTGRRPTDRLARNQYGMCPYCRPQPAAPPSIALSTAKATPGAENPLASSPNSLLFDPAGDKAFMGSDFGAVHDQSDKFRHHQQSFHRPRHGHRESAGGLQQRKCRCLLRYHPHSESGLRRQRGQSDFALGQCTEYLTTPWRPHSRPTD